MWRNRIRLLCGMSLSAMLVASALAAAPDPVVYYPLDELGAVVVDASGNGHDGTPEGALELNADGFSGGCFEFNGTDARIEIARPIQDEFTLAGWVKTSTPGVEAGTMAYDGSGLFWSDIGGSANDFVVAVLGTKLSFNIGNPNITVTSNADIVTGEWVHVAAVRETATPALSLYINGALDNRVDHSNSDSLDAQSLLVVGANPLDMRYYTGLLDEVKVFDIALSDSEIQQVMRVNEGASKDPDPPDAALDLPRDSSLRWMPGEFAATHDVYLGTSFDDVNDASRTDDRGVLVSRDQAATSYTPEGVFAFGQTYYWRIDEVNAAPDNTIFKGDVWSFTVEPLAYPIANVTASSNIEPVAGTDPENVVNGSGLDENDEHSIESGDMWRVYPDAGETPYIEFAFDQAYKLHEILVWNYNVELEPLLGFGFKDVTIEYSENGVDWTTLGDTTFNRGTGTSDYRANTTVDMAGVVAQYVRVTVINGYGEMGQYGLSEVRFLYIPVQAREPQPADGAVDVSANTMLSWRAGREAVSHEIYLSTDPNAMEIIDVTDEAMVDPGALDLETTYYWRVDEVNNAEAVSTWEGASWSFSTQAYIVVDDFESYTDDIDAGEAIFLTWLDGYEIDGNGSIVGHLNPPFAEQDIVHGGAQSMPLSFDNSNGITVSEAEFALSQDWTANDIQSLSLYFHGATGNTGQLYVKINGQKVQYTGAADAIATPWWRQWTIDLASVGVDLQNVRDLSIGVEGSGSGVLYVDDIRLYRAAPTPPREEVWLQAEAADTVTEPMNVYDDDPDAMGGAYIGTQDAVGDSSSNPPSPDGTASYTFTVAGGVYRISGRVIIPGNESFWVRIPGATTQTENHGSGWVSWTDPPNGSDWHWAEVFSADDGGDFVEFTMAAGTYTLEIGYREDGALLDAIVIESID